MGCSGLKSACFMPWICLGSGKTFTMSGREDLISTDEYQGDDSYDGIMSRSVSYLYQQLKERKDQIKFSLSASYLEIYNEGKNQYAVIHKHVQRLG